MNSYRNLYLLQYNQNNLLYLHSNTEFEDEVRQVISIGCMISMFKVFNEQHPLSILIII